MFIKRASNATKSAKSGIQGSKSSLTNSDVHNLSQVPSLNLIINYKSYTTTTKGLDKTDVSSLTKNQTAKGARTQPQQLSRVASSEALRNPALNKKKGPFKIEVEGRPFSFNNTQIDMKVGDLANAALGLSNQEATTSVSSIQPTTSAAASDSNQPTATPSSLSQALITKLQLPTIQSKDIRSTILTATGHNINKQNPLSSDSSSTIINSTRVPQSLVNHTAINNHMPTTSLHANHHNHFAPDFSSMLNLKSYQLTKFETKPAAVAFNSGPGALRPANPKKLESDFYDDNEDEFDDDDDYNVNDFTDSFKVSVNRLTDDSEGATAIEPPLIPEPQLDNDSLNSELSGLSKIKPNNIVFTDNTTSNSSKHISSKQILLIKNRKLMKKKKSDLLKISNPNKSAAAIKSGIDPTENTVVTHDASLPQVFGVNIQNDKSTANESNFL